MNDEELEATKKLNGVAKENNREEDIKKLNSLIEGCKECKFAACEQCEINWTEVQAIEHILAEREADKKKIDELEKENHKILENGLDVIKDSIAKQTVRDKIKELKNNLKYIACNEDCSKCFNQEGKALYRESNFIFCFAYHQIKALQELLEDK